MRTRDKRALLALGLWSGGLGLYLGGRSLLDLRASWAQKQLLLQATRTRKDLLRQELDRMGLERTRYAAAFPKELLESTPDQLRLKGQEGLLEAAQRSGLKGVRLRADSLDPAMAGRQLAWNLDGEGTLMQWVDTFAAIEKSQPLMSVQGYHLELPGDPWHPEEVGEEGPLLKGSLHCAWITAP